MTNKKIVFGLVGDLAAGKSTVSKYLREKYNINSYLYSTPLRDILKRIYIEESRENLQKLSIWLRENFDQQILGKIIARDVENDGNEMIIADGIRRPSDIAQLEQLPGFILIYITAEPHLRWQRQTNRNQNAGDAQKTFEQFMRDEESEAEKPIKELGGRAKFTITNNGTETELYQQIEDIIKSIKSY
ncbi:MAG: AAA family ATPase [Candidatus Magasanikbacteria bacterium]|nr:AAA family ATPase [Candidatus Magasanikbacteria bacterium]